MMFDGNIKAEWNQNILSNLKREFPKLSEWDDYKLLKEYDDYLMSDTGEETFLEWMIEST